MDPEDLADEVRTFQAICTRVCDRHNGHIINYLGDGILVIFGYPWAREFDTEHAVRAGMEMVQEIGQNNSSADWQHQRAIGIRVGIATGQVVVGEKAGKKRNQDEQIIGEAPILAARLQQIAKSGTVAVSMTTRNLTGNSFRFRNLGEHNLKGYPGGVPAWQLIQKRLYRHRRHRAPNQAIAPLIGRNHDLGFLAGHFIKLAKGDPAIICLAGKEGTGKSRLIHEFENTLNKQDVHRVHIHCSACDEKLALFPVIAELGRRLQFGLTTSDATLQEKIESMLIAVEIRYQEPLDLLLELLSTTAAGNIPQMLRGNHKRQDRVISLLADILFLMARQKPVLFVVEDIQWSDSATLQLLDIVIRNCKGHRLFVILTSRNDFQIRDQGPIILSHRRLTGLNQNQSSTLISSLYGDSPPPPGMQQAIINKCGGIPLYLEQYSQQDFLEHSKTNIDTCQQNPGSIPVSLQGSLNAILDDLGEAGKLVKLVSVLGKRFSHGAISSLASLNGLDAGNNLNILLRREIIRVAGMDPTIGYVAQHSLLIDTAYQSLLKKTRRKYQRQIAGLGLFDTHGVL